MVELRVAHTADLRPPELLAVRRLCDEAFASDGHGDGHGFGEEDFEHALGGVHALLRDGDELVGHAAVVMRRLLHGGRALRTGYVEAVAVRADRRRQGHAHTLMGAVESVVRGAYELGALSSSADGASLYSARGWLRWEGTASVLAPDGLRRTPEDEGGVWLLPVTAVLDPRGDLACDWRDGDVW